MSRWWQHSILYLQKSEEDGIFLIQRFFVLFCLLLLFLILPHLIMWNKFLLTCSLYFFHIRVISLMIVSFHWKWAFYLYFVFFIHVMYVCICTCVYLCVKDNLWSHSQEYHPPVLRQSFIGLDWLVSKFSSLHLLSIGIIGTLYL